MRSVEKLHPAISNLMNSLNSLGDAALPSSYESKGTVHRWLLYLSSKPSAADELTEAEAQQLAFDLERGMQDFLNLLERK